MDEERKCDICYHYRNGECTTWDCDFVLNAEVQKCRFADLCKKHYHNEKADECNHKQSWECPIADKIMDILMDVPFNEDYDGPVEEEEP